MIKVGSPEAVAARVAREKAAHEDSHIDDALRKWWAVFPHVFTNPSMENLHAFYRRELGSIQNKLVLEVGCGRGDFALWLLDQGAIVHGIDISRFNINRCEEKINARNLDPHRYAFTVMDCHKTSFPDKFFDRVVGNGILHHLDLPAALMEVDRILKPGAKAIFSEPLGENPLLRLYRFVAGIHTTDERPLKLDDLIYLRAHRTEMKYSGLMTLPASLLTSIILRSYPSNWFLRAATRTEDQLNNHHILDHWNRFAVLAHTTAGVASEVDAS